MAEEGAKPRGQATGDGGAEPELLCHQNSDGAFQHVAEQRRRGEALVAGAQHIGRADIARADGAQVGSTG